MQVKLERKKLKELMEELIEEIIEEHIEEFVEDLNELLDTDQIYDILLNKKTKWQERLEE